jgi:hypothetical protein
MIFGRCNLRIRISISISILIHIRMCKPAHISLPHLRLFLLFAPLASPVNSYGADAWVTLISLFMIWTTFSLPYIMCYRWRELSDITTVGSYYGFRLHTITLFAIFILSISSVREISSFIFIELVFEFTSISISPIMSERSERYIYNIL